MIEREKSREIKTCCVTFYQSGVIRLLLGDVLHTGGLELTRYLGMVVELKPEDNSASLAFETHNFFSKVKIAIFHQSSLLLIVIYFLTHLG